MEIKAEEIVDIRLYSDNTIQREIHMIFNEVLGTKHGTEINKIFYREAVRAIIFKNNMLLMIQTNRGGYEFPGGGIEKGETHQEAIIREVLEETGYQVEGVNNIIGVVTERRTDKFDSSMFFEMVSHYYICDVSGTEGKQKLENYEVDLDVKPIWVSVDDAILTNQNELSKQDKGIITWQNRELLVLKKLEEYKGRSK